MWSILFRGCIYVMWATGGPWLSPAVSGAHRPSVACGSSDHGTSLAPGWRLPPCPENAVQTSVVLAILLFLFVSRDPEMPSRESLTRTSRPSSWPSNSERVPQRTSCGVEPWPSGRVLDVCAVGCRDETELLQHR